MFNTQYNRLRVISNAGDRKRIVKAGVLNNKKQIVVKEKGHEDLYAYINSFADSVNIHVLLARFANGDKEALLQRAGAFIDISALPTNINEFVELYHNGESYFNSLPIEIKEKFNNNMTEFISKIGSSEFNDIMSVSPDEIRKQKIELVKENKEIHKEAAKVQFNNTVYGDLPNEGDIGLNPVKPPIIEREVK